MDAKAYPAKGVTLANGEATPILLPVETAQELLKVLPKNAKDLTQYAALAAPDGKGRQTIVTVDGKKTLTHSFQPIDATFPDYERGEIFPRTQSIHTALFNPDRFSRLLAQAGLGDKITFHLFKDRLVLEGEAKDGVKSRAVLMHLDLKKASGSPSKPAPEETPSQASKQEEPTKPSPKPTSAPASTPQSTGSPKGAPQMKGPQAGGGGQNKSFGKRRFSPRPADPNAVPGTLTPAQCAFYTFLLHRHGETLTPETLEGKIEKISDRITELKESLTPSNGEATYAQWRKLYFLLADNAPVDTRCEVLNTVTDIKATSALIEKWLKPAVSEKDAPSNVRRQAA